MITLRWISLAVLSGTHRHINDRPQRYSTDSSVRDDTSEGLEMGTVSVSGINPLAIDAFKTKAQKELKQIVATSEANTQNELADIKKIVSRQEDDIRKMRQEHQQEIEKLREQLSKILETVGGIDKQP
ncbi:hypothetical protein TrVE_jg7430 [Triparma verrucosa]|uniref:Uncharacterized protein n=1 Tax=Triparma verrucosa TaxID=1606542 RepID=A0A9W7FK32_9STRA|nr:hypothetical protein TrVE_jg7430 [Triparma verrucosa]